MHLREAETLGVFDHHDTGVGDIDTDFDDGGCDEDIGLATLEAAHGDFLVIGGHSAVEQAKA